MPTQTRFMKHCPLFALLLVALSTATFADTPAKISEDYRKQSASALAKLNDTLEKATLPLISKLISSGDTAGSEQLTAQLKSKLAADPVPVPYASATLLFAQYDQARIKIMEPAQKAAIARIDAMLSTPEGGKIDIVTELGKVRKEIESGKPAPLASSPPAGLVKEWTYHLSAATDRVSGTVAFARNGTLKLDFPNNKDEGTWKKTKEPNVYETNVNGEKGILTITGMVAEWKRGELIRYLKATEGSPPL